MAPHPSPSTHAPPHRNLWRPLAAVALLAIALRVLYFAEYVNLPFLYGPICDSQVYLEQARHVAAGRHGDPTLLAYSPLYGYALWLLGQGESLLAPVLFQLCAGVAIACLLFLGLAHHTGSRLAGGVAAGLYLAYPTTLFYETKILSETLGLLLAAAALLLCLPRISARHDRPWRTLLSGTLLGLAILARASLVFIGPLAVIAAVFPWSEQDKPWRFRLQRAAGLGLGLAGILFAHGCWTYAHAGRFVPVIFVSSTVEHTASLPVGHSLHDTPQVGQSGRAAPSDVIDQTRAMLRGESEGRPAWRSIDWSSYLSAAPGKLAATFAPAERLYQYGLLGERSELRSLGSLPASFSTLALFGAVGLAVLLLSGQGRSAVPLAPWILGTLATTTLYHPTSRYRLVMVLPLCVLAGLAAPRVLALGRRFRTVLAGALGIATLGLAIQFHSAAPLYPALWESHKAESAIVAGDRRSAASYLSSARALAAEDASQLAEISRVRAVCEARFRACD